MQQQTIPISWADSALDTNNILHEYCTHQLQKAERYGVSYERLWHTIDAYIAGGGKRIRPYLVTLTYQAYGGQDIAAVTPISAAWELLHACLLVHDDIIDKDTVRHGQPNIAGVYETIYGKQLGSETSHFAASAALLVGDLLLSGAHQLLLQADISADKKLEASDLLSDATFGVAGGELLDVEAVFDDVALVQSEKIAQYKTAEYSFEYPLLCGAKLAGASVSQQKLLRQFGTNIGIAFQLADDLLGVFGQSSVTGKSTDTDIREQKRTLLIQEALQQLPDSQAQRLRALYAYGYVLMDADIVEVRGLIAASGAEALVRSRAQAYIDKALGCIIDLDTDEKYKAAYRDLVQKILERAA